MASRKKMKAKNSSHSNGRTQMKAGKNGRNQTPANTARKTHLSQFGSQHRPVESWSERRTAARRRRKLESGGID